MTVWRKTSLGKVTGIATGELGGIFLSQNGTCSPSTSRPCLLCGQHHVGTDLASMHRKDTHEWPSALLLTQPCHLPTHKPDRWSFLPPGGGPAGPARGMSPGQGVELLIQEQKNREPPLPYNPRPRPHSHHSTDSLPWLFQGSSGIGRTTSPWPRTRDLMMITGRTWLTPL